MKTAGWTTLCYAVLVFAGGWIGYATAGSIASVIAGVVFGLILLASGIGVILGKRHAILIALTATLILDAFFTYRFFSSFSFMPSGMMACLSLLVLIIQVTSLRHGHRRRRS
jgi:uncharacterized membrane protein (UPF0136 family)